MNSVRKALSLYFIPVLVLFFLIAAGAVFAQEEENKTLEDTLASMKADLGLTDSQADAARPIVEEYLYERAQLEQRMKEQVLVDRSPTLRQLEKIKDDEKWKLSHILTVEQMKKLNHKDQLKDFFNKDDMNRDTGWEPKGTGLNPGLNF